MRSLPVMITASEALPGRPTPLEVNRPHLSLHRSMNAPYPEGVEVAYLALGCFWGAERKFFETPGVYVTAVGYQGGFTPNPTYEEVCTGRTGHAEVVKVVYNPSEVSFGELLRVFYENHDPTQGFRQGGDVGTQYRSAIFYVNDEQLATAKSVTANFAERLSAAGFGPITTEISAAGAFYMAEEYHQQYLIANPNGYCGLGGTGVACPVGVL